MPDVAVKSGKAFFLVNRLDTFGGFDDCGDEKGFMNIDATIKLRRLNNS